MTKFQQIKDNFWYGVFGDLKLIIDKNTGYFNVSHLCKSGNKKFDKWLENTKSQEFMIFLEKYHQRLDLDFQKVLYRVEGLQSMLYDFHGIYVPDDVITTVAYWISNEFCVKVKAIVKDYHGGVCTEKHVKIVENLKMERDQFRMERDQSRRERDQLEKERNRLRRERDRLRMEDDSTEDDSTEDTMDDSTEEDAMDDSTEDYKTKNSRKLPSFVLIKKHDKDCSYPYVVLRTQKQSFDTRIKALNKKFPDMEILYQLKYNPVAINLFDRIKSQFRYIKTHYSEIGLSNDSTEEQFVKDIAKLAKLNY